VFTGKANCPYYAKAELLADYLQANLPDFSVHKITQHPDEWEVRDSKSKSEGRCPSALQSNKCAYL